jgi:hypothetical protein
MNRRSFYKLSLMILLGLFFSINLYAGVPYKVDFSSASGDVEDWFEKIGWEFKEDMEDMQPRFENGSLIIEPDDDDLGVIAYQFPKGKGLKGIKKIRVEWGVNQYSDGANWDGPKSKKRNTREPISLMIFFGDEKVESGSSFVPNLPYYIALFLGEKEKAGQVYYGNYWQKGGRYLCEPCDGSLNKTFVTEVMLEDKFKELFEMDMPPVTGLTIEVDAQDTNKKNGRHSKAYFKKIELFD